MKPINSIDKVTAKPINSNSQMGPHWRSQLDYSENQASQTQEEPQGKEAEQNVEFEAEPDVQTHLHSEVVPSSQPEDDQEEDEINHVLPADFFNQYKTDQLRRQLDSWGLKRVKSKKAMISLLTVTSKLMKLEDLSEAYNRFKSGESDILVFAESNATSAADLGTQSQSSMAVLAMVKKGYFEKIRDLIKKNPDIYHKILIYQPINMKTFYEFVKDELKIEKLDRNIVSDCLDELGICYTSMDEEGGSSQRKSRY
ncbi:unnamed protein product [Ambrosiozyma monospora]|uniref:Structure-specific endonuclease subunit SLX4 n=1 Tax=Ambrosiozyma monospora TaxID=43982 RepID=A0A9W7DJW8_AMBMO|nr:unnamed protein product [Ambrosiozyma monospora]